ncbi:hypothetical protein FOZ61_002208 [Perkinsus olseni]|uniref:PHD-type domain-containing protein n=1 Tax=Perkinsus olseni TaxID=32597 RepID=A0A7J6MEJ7_PEROL|nr:hypothetical protein FOZ61_002208 [Perkinsus olseni]
MISLDFYMPGAVSSPTGPMVTSEAKPAGDAVEDTVAANDAPITNDTEGLIRENSIGDAAVEGVEKTTNPSVTTEHVEEPAKAATAVETAQEAASADGENSVTTGSKDGDDTGSNEAVGEDGEDTGATDGSLGEDHAQSEKLVGEDKEVPLIVAVDTEPAADAANEETMTKPDEDAGDSKESQKSSGDSEIMEGAADETHERPCGVRESSTDKDKHVEDDAAVDDDKAGDVLVTAEEQEPVEEQSKDGSGEDGAQEDYEVWTGGETTAGEEDDCEFLTLDGVKEAMVKITTQLEEDEDNSDLKVLEEFTEEYEKMSETQTSLQKKLTTVLAETNALWQEFEKYRDEYAKVMWEEKKDEREKGQSAQQWDWKQSDGDGGNQTWNQNGNWRASEDGQQQESWKSNEKSNWGYDGGGDQQQQKGGWKKGGDNWTSSNDGDGQGEQWKATWKEGAAEEDSSRTDGDEKWKAWGKSGDEKPAAASWRDAEGGTGESAEWQPKSGGRQGYDKKWDDGSSGKDQGNWWKDNQRGDKKGWQQQQQQQSWGKDQANAAEDAPPPAADAEESSTVKEVPAEATAAAAKPGEPSYSDLQAEVIRLRKAVAENEKVQAENAAAEAASPPPPAPATEAPSAPPVAQPLPPAQPVAAGPAPAAPPAVATAPLVPQQDGRAMEDMAQKMGKEIEDRLNSQYKEKIAEMERRHYEEMQSQMRYMMQQQQMASPMPPPRDFGGRGPRSTGYPTYPQGEYDRYDSQYGASFSRYDDRYRRERPLSPYRDGSVSGMSGYAARSPTDYRDYRDSPSAAQVSAAPPPARDRRETLRDQLSPRDAKPRRPHQPPNVDRTISRAAPEPRAQRTETFPPSTAAAPPVAPVGLPEPPRSTRSTAPLAEEALSLVRPHFSPSGVMDSPIVTADVQWQQQQQDQLPPFVNSTVKNPPPSSWLPPVAPATAAGGKGLTTPTSSSPLFAKEGTVDGSVDDSRLGSSSTTVQKKKKKHKRKKHRHRDDEADGELRSPRKKHKKKRRVRDILGKSPRLSELDDSAEPSTSLAFGEGSGSEYDDEEIALESARRLWLEVRNEEPSPALIAPAMELLGRAVNAAAVPPVNPICFAQSAPMWPGGGGGGGGGVRRPPIQGWAIQLEAAGQDPIDATAGTSPVRVEAAITLPCASQMKPGAQYGRYMREEPPPLTPEMLWLTVDGESIAPSRVSDGAAGLSVHCSGVALDPRPESLTEAQILRIRLREVVERKREMARRAKDRAESFTVARRSVNAPAVETMKALMRARPPPMNVYPHNADLKPTFGVTTSDDPAGDTSFLVCSICLGPDLARGNQMVVCSSCGVAGHQYCYEINRIYDEDSWLCRLCSALENGDASESDDLDCFLCGGDRRCLGGGLMTSVMLQGTIRWIHVRCGMFAWKCRSIPDVERAAMRLPQSESASPVCTICDKAVGETVKCGSTGCSRHFHVSCATRNALTVPEAADHNWLIYCRQHMADADSFGTIGKLTKAIAASPYAEQTEGGFAAAIANSAAAPMVDEAYGLYRDVDAEDLWLAWMDPGETVKESTTPKAAVDRPSSLTTPSTAPPPATGRTNASPIGHPSSLRKACVMCLHTDGDLVDIPGGPGVPPGCSAKLHPRCAHWMGLAPVFNFHDLRQGSVIRPRNFLQSCNYCNSVLGITMKCSKCNKSFHPHCAAKNGCIVRVEDYESGIQLSGRSAELWLSRRTVKGGFSVWVDCDAH